MAFKDKLVELDSKQREKSIFNYMLSQLAIALQIDECDIDATQPLINLGIDSLIAVEFRNRLRLLTEIDLPVVKLLEGASLQTLAHYLNEQFESQQRALHGDQGINTAAVDDALASDVDMSVMIEGAL